MNTKETTIKKGAVTYLLNVTLERDNAVWRASVPGLEFKGAVAWGGTQQVALANLQDTARIAVEELLERGETLPENVRVTENVTLAVTL